jgi:transcriptional regulator with XRE-family HTH domain
LGGSLPNVAKFTYNFWEVNKQNLGSKIVNEEEIITRRKKFGEFIRTLRELEDHRKTDRRSQIWTREHLAELSGLSLKQIISIEAGDTVHLLPHLNALATAFRLTTIETVELYNRAGYTYPYKSTQNPESKKWLKELFTQINYPASARNALWDVICFNTYHYQLFGFTPEMIKAMNTKQPIGSNLLRVLIDPLFNHQSNAGGDALWQSNVLQIIRRFRSATFSYEDTDRYHEILKAMDNYPIFKNFWQLSERPSHEPNLTLGRPKMRVFNKTFGTMDFMSLRVRRYFGDDIDVSVYVPLAKSEKNYQKLRDSIEKNNVYFFREQPIK